MNLLFACIEALVLVLALSLDALIASFAYGANKIRIPFKSAMVINLVCSSLLGISLIIGGLIRNFVPHSVTAYICFAILFILSITKFFDFAIKKWIKKSNTLSPKTEFNFLNFHFILQIIGDATAADTDSSKVLSCKEALALGFALSLDGLAVGFGSGLESANMLLIFLFSLITDIIAVVLGSYLGNKVAAKRDLNLSWLSGAILMILAITKLL